MTTGLEVPVVDADALAIMRARGGSWAAYQNVALDSKMCGHCQFLKVGEGCTFVKPPDAYPSDTVYGPGWKYLYLGMVNLETGIIDVDERERS